MFAIDTNVVVRCLVDEDPEQCRRARSLVSSGIVFLSTTVLLETEWVLRGVFDLQPSDILAALRKFFSLPTIVLEDSQAALRACAGTRNGFCRCAAPRQFSELRSVRKLRQRVGEGGGQVGCDRGAGAVGRQRIGADDARKDRI